MTAFCDWVAVVAFLIALILAVVQPSAPTAPARWTWPTFVALGLLAWAIPIALTASHISHS